MSHPDMTSFSVEVPINDSEAMKKFQIFRLDIKNMKIDRQFQEQEEKRNRLIGITAFVIIIILTIGGFVISLKL